MTPTLKRDRNLGSSLIRHFARFLLVGVVLLAPALFAQQIPVTIVQDVGVPTAPVSITGLDKAEVGEYGPFRWGGAQVTMQLQPLGVPMHVAILVQGVRPQGKAPAQVG